MRVLFMFLIVILFAGCGATHGGYGGYVPGYEALGVVVANQALVASIADQQGWVSYGQPYGQQFGYGNVPICRAQDLVGLPPISVSQPVLVRVSKSKGHQTKDIIGGAAIGAGLGYVTSGGWQGASYGGAAGAGGGLLVVNHEQDLCLLLPVKAP